VKKETYKDMLNLISYPHFYSNLSVKEKKQFFLTDGKLAYVDHSGSLPKEIISFGFRSQPSPAVEPDVLEPKVVPPPQEIPEKEPGIQPVQPLEEPDEDGDGTPFEPCRRTCPTPEPEDQTTGVNHLFKRMLNWLHWS